MTTCCQDLNHGNGQTDLNTIQGISDDEDTVGKSVTLTICQVIDDRYSRILIIKEPLQINNIKPLSHYPVSYSPM